MDPFDEELEAEVQKVLDPGGERRRQVAVADLQSPPGLRVAWRIASVVAGVVAVAAAAILLVLLFLLG